MLGIQAGCTPHKESGLSCLIIMLKDECAQMLRALRADNESRPQTLHFVHVAQAEAIVPAVLLDLGQEVVHIHLRVVVLPHDLLIDLFELVQRHLHLH